MPDIVLIDGNGEAQTIAGAKALGVDTVDGGIAVFVSEDAVPSNYVHPATHPASMISGLVVGDVPQLAIAERDFTLEKELGIYVYEVPGAWEHTLGDTYTVHWNGTDYTLQVKDFENIISGFSIHYLGNATKFWGLGLGEDTGEPFVVAIDDNFTCAIMTDALGPHTVGITAPNAIKKLDAKYLPDGIATEEWVEEKISEIEVSGGGSSGGGSSEVEILPEQEIVLTSTDTSYAENTIYGVWDNSGETELLTQLSQMKTGETYRVILNGMEYECPDKLLDEMGEIPSNVQLNAGALLGNPILLDMGIDVDSGESFAVLVEDCVITQESGATDHIQVAAIVVQSDIVGAESITCTIRIYQPGATNAITWDDLMDGKDDTDLFAKQTVDRFEPNSLYGGLYCAPFNFPESGNTDLLTDSFDLLIGETYTVEWDGTEYEVTSMDASALMAGALFLGNGTPLGLSGNGEPFAIGWIAGRGVTFLSITETVDTHTIRFYQKGAARTIKREYIPAPPFFDLTAMGLPTLTPGADVELEIDTTEIREAMAKGVVKFQVAMGDGNYSVPVNIIGVPVETMGIYACVTPTFSNESIMTIHIEVTGTHIYGRIRMLTLTALS